MTNSKSWDAYYEEFPVPEFIINRMWREFSTLIRANLQTQTPLVVAELGGADSSLYPRFVNDYPVAEYHALDQNTMGLERFRQKHAPRTYTHELDLLADPLPAITADIVFSGGLIEHFDPVQTAEVIAAHFVLTKPGGLV